MNISKIRDGGLCTAVVMVLLMSAVHQANSSVVDGTPTGRWPTATPASVGLDQKRLAALGAALARGKYSLVDSFQVFRCGKVVYERQYSHDYSKIYQKQVGVRGPLNAHLTGPYNYFDPAFHPYYQSTDLHTMQSISKTVTATVIGIALARGDFKSGLDTPVLTWFDAASVKNVDERKRRMTLRDLLTMTHGLGVIFDESPISKAMIDAGVFGGGRHAAG